VKTPEHKRLRDHESRKANWRKWGPYLSERAWGTVREDYSGSGDSWNYFPFDQSHMRAYRWSEDGIGGISDRDQFCCFAFAFWNHKDPILKERLFGLTGEQGNHGEDVKECYYYLDNTPTHSYMKMLYKYPHAEYPYQDLIEENGKRGKQDPEYELLDTGIFDEGRYFDIEFEYAKAGEDDILCKLTVHNRGPEEAKLLVLPTLWFRNTWAWGYMGGPMGRTTAKPHIKRMKSIDGVAAAEVSHSHVGDYFFYADEGERWFFTENDSNMEKIWNRPNATPYTKESFHRYFCDDDHSAVKADNFGTKGTIPYDLELGAGESRTLRFRLTSKASKKPFRDFDTLFATRQAEADGFYETVAPPTLSDQEKLIQRQAFAGLLWSKQLYYYDVQQWLSGDIAFPDPPEERYWGRNSNWEHLVNFDVMSMPDKWEYPWYASWDLGFHCITFALIDPAFAKRQLTLLTREWYMHPNGELPAYEWSFDDANPPVHAWAAWRTFKIEEKMCGKGDREFLEGIYHKLLLNFTWWVNRKDQDGRNVFQGGFLGLDNISLFDRSEALPTGGRIDQSDGTAWMGFYCLGMMRIALGLAIKDPIYQDSATKFFEHFLRIAHAMTAAGRNGPSLWNDEDGFFYDVLHLPDGSNIPLKVRSLVGLLPLLAVETIDPETFEAMPVFRRRLHWFLSQRPILSQNMASVDDPGVGERRLLAILTRERLISVLRYMLDENEFLSPYGLRSVSKVHQEHPFVFECTGKKYEINYEPAESETDLFGGNSNWRGPIWFPINFLIIESLQKFHHYYGDDLKVEFPTGSDHWITLGEVADELSRRLSSLFLQDESGNRPVYSDTPIYANDPHFKDLLLFHEYFHGETGKGLGASHQTGWTSVVAKLIQRSGGKH
jgi:Mannosylglycerate hydrolase MGH1-like glycoside hydrolase domain